MTAASDGSRGRGPLLAWASALLFFGALAGANALRVAAPGSAGDYEFLESAAFGLAFFVLWVAAFGRLWPAVLAAFLLFAWWWPLELYLRLTYQTPVAPQFISLALDSNLGESAEFAVTFGRQLLLAIGLVAALGAPALVLCRRYPVRWSHRSRWWVLVAFPLAGFGMYQLFQQQEPDWLHAAEDPFRVPPLPFWTDKWRAVYPLTLPLALERFHEDAQRVSRMREHIAGFRFGAVRAQAPLDAVVLVLGESSRADRWSLGGYGRKTNPLLEQRSNLVFFSNLVTPSVATRYAVPFILSRRPVLLADGKPNPRLEPSLTVAFNEAGYRSTWISNQSGTGFWDSTTAYYARDAQSVRFLNPTGAERAGHLDGGLVEPVATVLRSAGPQLIVVHTMGSHFHYANRYPPDFDRFQPSLGVATPINARPGQQRTEINNSYDNSILYTDHVLDRLIAQLAQRGGRSVLAFVADHGEDIDGPACPGSTLKRESRWSYRVPALVWVSDALAREQPQLLPTLRSRAGDPLRTDAVYPTLLALAGVSIPPDGEARSPSLLAAPAPGPRLVVGKDNAWTDFDAAEKRDPCRIAQPLLH